MHPDHEPPAADSVLSIADLTVHLQGRPRLIQLALQVAGGEFISVLGDNGAGKTTLLRAILGLIPRTSGRIGLFGQQVGWRNLPALRRRIGYVPQTLPFDAAMPISARDVIAIGRSARRGLARRLTAHDEELILQAAAEAGVQDLLARPMGQLSGGERQKVQIARALCQQPEMLLLDEFAAHLSETARQSCLQLLTRLYRQHHFAIIMITHDRSAIPTPCRRAVVLANGAKQFDGPLAQAPTIQEFNRPC